MKKSKTLKENEKNVLKFKKYLINELGDDYVKLILSQVKVTLHGLKERLFPNCDYVSIVIHMDKLGMDLSKLDKLIFMIAAIEIDNKIK